MRAEKQTSEIRKRQIAGAAMSLIARRGVKGLSVAAVARRVGWSLRPSTAILKEKKKSWSRP